jgi:hypothetical protein
MSPSVLCVARSVSFFVAFAIVSSARAQQPTERIPPPKLMTSPLPKSITSPFVGLDDPKPLTPAQLEALAKIKQRFVTAEQGDDELRKLLKERYRCALEEFELTRRREDIVFDKGVWLDQLISSHRKMVETALELLNLPEEQAQILDDLLRNAIELDKNFRERVQRGLALPQDAERAHGHRLDVETALLKVKRKIKADK